MPDLKPSLDRIRAVDKLFDKQVGRQIALGYHVAADLVSEYPSFSEKHDAWRERMEPLRAVARKEAVMEDKIPFIIVIPVRIVPFEPQLFGVTVKSLSARSTATQLANSIRNVRKGIPWDVPYLIFKVRDGSEFLNVAPIDSAAKLHKRALLELTAEEGIATATHYPEILTRLSLNMAGSRCGIMGKVPFLWLMKARPELSYHEESEADPSFGTPYCETLGVA